MTKTKMRLMIDSSVKDELERAKLTELHQIVVHQVMRLEIHDYVKVTMEVEGVESHLPPAKLPGAGYLDTSFDCGALSERQRQIAEMLCNHYSIKRIASELFVSVNTVKKHIQNMKKALNTDLSGADFIYALQQMLQKGSVDLDKRTPIG
ncbi:helix-turn-helix transcriptional regulator [Brevibacillus migulae]|uniref:helix-turn-helix transcriptional regulator n=1 Tax=Brevibacillus migulae TaxID=1644114 RepID=UPI001430C824|nr:LuxR C-terminal-related transcriptional regulator [Brevibacillus migulae]